MFSVKYANCVPINLDVALTVNEMSHQNCVQRLFEFMMFSLNS